MSSVSWLISLCPLIVATAEPSFIVFCLKRLKISIVCQTQSVHDNKKTAVKGNGPQTLTAV